MSSPRPAGVIAGAGQPWAVLTWSAGGGNRPAGERATPSPERGALLVRGLAGTEPVRVGPAAEVVGWARDLEHALQPRWVWWSAADGARPLVLAGLRPRRCWDVAEAHRLLFGGSRGEARRAWAGGRGLDPDTVPAPPAGDLFDFGSPDDPAAPVDDEDPVRADGHLDPATDDPAWLGADSHLVRWAELALETADRQQGLLTRRGDRAVTTAHAESAAAVLCLELEHDGLPVDRPALEALIRAAAGPRPGSDEDAHRVRTERDLQVLRHAPGGVSGTGVDLRNPVQVRELLAAAGVRVPDTRAWRLADYRATHPLVEALLRWRKDERVATTYGYHWMDRHVGPDDRLRGGWTASDGAAGRMTAQNGLHNLPTPLRPAVAAHPGHRLVRADLGQVEPRVLAAVSGDEAFAEAARSADLYAPVAARLGVDRAVAKVAVLAAMYGQTSGVAGEALLGLRRSYPVAMDYLDRAAAAGEAGRDVQTYGGRLVRVGRPGPGETHARRAARGRFARNAVVQGAAAELFKAWAATVRAAIGELDAGVVLCLHDELLVHVPAPHAQRVAALVQDCLTDAARRWTGSGRVRFVADTAIVDRWSQAKG